jgi:hypothetical protein
MMVMIAPHSKHKVTIENSIPELLSVLSAQRMSSEEDLKAAIYDYVAVSQLFD